MPPAIDKIIHFVILGAKPRVIIDYYPSIMATGKRDCGRKKKKKNRIVYVKLQVTFQDIISRSANPKVMVHN